VSSLIRPRLLAAAALLLVLGGAWQYFGAGSNANGSVVASTQAQKESSVFTPVSANSGSHDLILGSKDSAQPKNMEEFLTGVIKDVDAYWTKVFKESNLPEPKVNYKWIPEGQTAASACGAADGTLGDSAAAYCQGDDTMYISLKFATDIYNGALDQALPGSSQGYGRTAGDFSVAYIVAHEYGHEVQDELGLFEKYGNQLPTMAFELQADCYSGTWAQSAYKENRLEDGDVQEALDSALAVGDFDADQPGHHGTPEQREAAWKTGFDSGDPSSCSKYLDASALGDSGSSSDSDSAPQQQGPSTDQPEQQDPTYGQPEQQDPTYGEPEQQDPTYGQPDPGYGYPQEQDPSYGEPEQQDPSYGQPDPGYGYPEQQDPTYGPSDTI